MKRRAVIASAFLSAVYFIAETLLSFSPGGSVAEILLPAAARSM